MIWRKLIAAGSFLVLLGGLLLWAAPARAEAPWTRTSADGQPVIVLYFFWSAQCPHCLEARPFVQEFPARLPWLKLDERELTAHPENRRAYVALARSVGQAASSVPAFLFCGEMHVGWESADTTGAFLQERLKQCHARVLAGKQAASAAPAPTLNAPLLGEIDSAHLSLPAFTLIIAGLDAFNPCAFFVLLFLPGLLANQHDRRRMLAIGVLFVLVSGLFYFAFMAAWLNVFRLFGELVWVTTAAAGLAIFIALINIKDLFAFKRGLSLSIPESRLPGRRARRSPSPG